MSISLLIRDMFKLFITGAGETVQWLRELAVLTLSVPRMHTVTNNLLVSSPGVPTTSSGLSRLLMHAVPIN